MRKSIFRGLLMVIMALFTLASCHKYEEGPKYTVLTKKARITNTWKLISISLNGSGGPPSSGTTIWFLGKDEVAQQSFYENNNTTVINGFWDFNSSKTKLIITDADSNFEEYTIVKLKNKELKLSQNMGADVIVWTFIENE